MIHDNLDDSVEAQSTLFQQLVQRPGLVNGSRKPVEDEPPGGIVAAQPIGDQLRLPGSPR